MKYREMAIEMLKLMGQELIDRAEELIPSTEGIKDIDVWISIPMMSDGELCIPEIRVNTSAYPKRMARLRSLWNSINCKEEAICSRFR